MSLSSIEFTTLGKQAAAQEAKREAVSELPAAPEPTTVPADAALAVAGTGPVVPAVGPAVGPAVKVRSDALSPLKST